MQIKEIVLYGVNGEVRNLSLNLGTVNIISGKSKSGKSVIGDIIDYCLGGDSCDIADGVVRETVAWYALLLNLGDENIFVARETPPFGQQSTNKFYYEVGKNLVVPESKSFVANTNTAGIEEMLSRKLGIVENLNIPPEGQTRLPLSANIRHALYYCFQNQDEIAAKNFLFHDQSKDYITQAIKDTLPYFLGIVNEETLALENERALLKRNLAVEKRGLEELKMLQGGGLQKGISLVSEARSVGLLLDDCLDYDNFNEIYRALLETAGDWKPIEVTTIGMDKLSFLQNELSKIRSEADSIAEDIRNAKSFAGETNGFVSEIEHQKIRLQSIGLFETLSFEPSDCPLCANALSNPLPSVDAIKTAIKNLDANLTSVSREKPKLRKYIDELEHKLQELKEKERVFKAEIDGVYAENQDAMLLRDLNSRRAKTLGRISLWLESVQIADNNSAKEAAVLTMQRRLEEIDKLLDRDDVEDRKKSILNRMSVEMSQWAKELQLEHSDNPYRLDMGKATVVVDKPERPVPLQQLGSGSNWVGIHLIAYFAPHKYFISMNRPVPRCLFIDQPSQVYFPSDMDAKNTDREEVNNLYKFIFDRVKEMKGEMQVILVDHADLNNDEFQKSVIEKWWGEEKLIPESWYKK